MKNSVTVVIDCLVGFLMKNKFAIGKMLSKMTDNMNFNLKNIQKLFGSIKYTDDDNQSLLHILVDKKYDETKCLIAIKSLLQAGLSPNLEDDFNYNFIQTALYTGYSENFILNIIGEAIKYGLDVNHVDSDKDTIMHTAIYSDDYLGEIVAIYDLLCANGFDSSLEDHESRNLLEAMNFQGQYSDSQIKRFTEKFRKYNTKETKPTVVSDTSLKEKVIFDNLSLSNDDTLLKEEVMKNKVDIEKMLSKMTDNMNFNLKNIQKLFDSIKYTDDDNQSLLHILVDKKYDEAKCLIAIKSLLQAGLSPNLEDDFNYNFIQTALYTGYSENFILNIIGEAIKYGLDVNHVDSDKDTIMHTAIYSDDYLGEIVAIYDLLCANGFDSSLEDHESRNLLEAMNFQGQYSDSQIKRFTEKFRKYNTKETKPTVVSDTSLKEKVIFDNLSLSNDDTLELEQYGTILNKKNYISSPTVGREKELKNLMITLAQDKKKPLIVGESGVGKTALVDELVYRIRLKQVPSFLQNKIVLEVSSSELVSGCMYLGQFEEKMVNLMKLCEKYDVILFIDEIHTIYGTGTTKNNENDMAAILKNYLTKSNLKVIGTITDDEYDKFFSKDALKRRFEKIIVKEPNIDVLYQIIDKVIEDYYKITNILFENENIRRQVVDIIVEATMKKHRVYNDMVNNPDLSISIIDKAFAIAKVYDDKFITIGHFIESFEDCNRIYEKIKEQSIEQLKSLDNNIIEPLPKVLRINFNAFRK